MSQPTDIEAYIRQQTGASRALPVAVVQSLWSGYGNIVRYQLSGAEYPSVIVKQISPPAHDNTLDNHPRGWNTDVGHQRKLKSYKVEASWYQHWASRCNRSCTVPLCFGVREDDNETTIILEDLNTSGYPQRHQSVRTIELHACLQWLAGFHACFLAQSPEGLWTTGTYWHLDTRPEEWAAMPSGALKDAAKAIDHKLNNARYKTLVHGDAKIANFCFSLNGNDVAAVDFQYVGGGCGMKDLAYFMGSCMDEDECQQRQDECLDIYFSALQTQLDDSHKSTNTAELEQEWRELFPFAWADFYRFLAGWMPGHKKMNRYSTAVAEKVLASL